MGRLCYIGHSKVQVSGIYSHSVVPLKEVTRLIPRGRRTRYWMTTIPMLVGAFASQDWRTHAGPLTE